MNPSQGRGLIFRNDFSPHEGARPDPLNTKWGNLHFHRTTEPLLVEQYFSAPADYLALCSVDGDVVALIDVLPHRDEVDPTTGWTLMRRLPADAGKPDVPGLYISRSCSYFWETVPYLARDERRVENADLSGPDHSADGCRYGICT